MANKQQRRREKNINGMVKVVEMLAFDEDLRKSFLDDAGETLEELGVKVKDRRILKNLSAEIKRLIEAEIFYEIEEHDPIGPVADMSASVAVSPSTGVITSVATTVATVTKDDRVTPNGDWEKVEVDFGRIALLEKNITNERRIRGLEKQLKFRK